MNMTLRLLALLLFMGCCASRVSADEAAAARKVVMLSGTDSSQAWEKAAQANLEKHMAGRAGLCEFKKSVISPEPHSGSEKWLSGLDDNDILVVFQEDAMERVLEEYDSLPAGLQIVFAGFRGASPDFKLRYPNITGFGGGELASTFGMMFGFYPETGVVMVITDYPVKLTELKERIRRMVPGSEKIRLELFNVSEGASAEMLSALSKLPADSAVIFDVRRRGRGDVFWAIEESDGGVEAMARHPVFSTISSLIGHGSVGGFICDGERTGREVSSLLDGLLAGRDVRNIPFSAMPSVPVADIMAMRSAGLREADLPSGTVRRHAAAAERSAGQAQLRSVLAALPYVLIAVILVFYWLQLRRFRRSTKAYGERFLATFDAVVDGMILVNAQGRIAMLNPMAEKILGVSISSARGMPLEDVFRISGGAGSILRKVAESGSRRTLEQDTVLIGRSGEHLRLSGSASPVWSSDGNITGTVLVFSDVTSEMIQQEERSTEFRMLETAAAMAGLSYAMLSFEGDKLTPARVGRHDSWGVDDEGRLLDVHEWVHPEDVVMFMEQWRSLSRGDCEEMKLQYRSQRRGRVEFFRLFARRMPDESGGGRLFACAVQNITESCGNERRLNDTNSLFRKIIDELPCFLIVKDAGDDCRYIIANSAWRDAVGRRENEIVGRTDFDIFDMDAAKRFRHDDRKVLADGDGNILRFVEEFPTREGVRSVQTFKTSFKSSDGRIYLLAAAIDVTELRQARNDAEEARQLLNTVFDNAPIGLFLKDPDDHFRYVMWNKQLAKYTGVAPSDLVGKSDILPRISLERAEEIRKQDNAVIGSNGAMSFEETREAAGNRGYYRITKLQVSTPSGKRYLLGSMVDMTERVMLEQSLKQTIRRQNLLLSNELIYNECLRDINNGDDLEQVIVKTLGALGRKFDAERCFIIHTGSMMDLTDRNFEWTDEGVASCIDIWKRFNSREIRDLDSSVDDGVYRMDAVSGYPGIYRQIDEFAGGALRGREMVAAVVDYRGEIWGVLCIVCKEGANAELIREEGDVLKSCGALLLLAKEHARQVLRLDDAVNMRKMILNNVAVPIFLFDAEARMLSVNPAGCRLIGKTESEILSEPCCHNYCRNAKDIANCPVMRCIATGRTEHGDIRIGDREMTLTAEPIFDGAGKLRYVIKSAVDVTEINENRRQLQSAMEAAQAAERAKTDFIATMNHELRTPLNAVLGFAELLEMGGLTPDETRDYLDALYQSGVKLKNMVDDVLDLSRLDTDVSESVPVLSDIGGVIADAAAGFASAINDKKIAFGIDVGDEPVKVLVDASRLVRILTNLLDNAVKFTGSGGSICVKASFCRDDAAAGTLRISVSDTGIGIAGQTLSRVFEPFVQDDAVRSSRAYQGSGMGLAISRRLAESMGGELTASSEPGKGSVFTLELKQVRYV